MLAGNALNFFCHLNRQSDLYSLISTNADYLVDAICHSLRYDQRESSASLPLRVLKGILLFAGGAIAPIVDDILDDVMRGLDRGEEQFLIDYLEVKFTLAIIQFPDLARNCNSASIKDG